MNQNSGRTRSDEIGRLAEQCAAQIPSPARSFHDDVTAFEGALRDLLHAVRDLDPRFAFDRDGRPAAIHAIRAALPAMEREILDAVLDDHACELAATQEALYQVIISKLTP